MRAQPAAARSWPPRCRSPPASAGPGGLVIRRIDARKALESQRPRCCGALTKCRRRDSNPDARIMIPDDFGLAIGDPRRIGHAVGHNRTLGGTPFRVRRHRRSRPRAWSVERCCGALLGGKARKRRTCRTFFEAAEGTRTLDLLHGKQTLIVPSYRFIPAYGQQRRVRCAGDSLRFAAFVGVLAPNWHRRRETRGRAFAARASGAGVRYSVVLEGAVRTHPKK